MLRRKPTAIKLQVEDLTEYTEHCKQVELESTKRQDEQKSTNDTQKLLQDLRNLGENSHSKARQVEISRRIGFDPRPITPETTSHYQNLH